LLASRGAHAGYKSSASNWAVKLSGTATAGSFSGALSVVRATADTMQYVGCETYWYGPTATNLSTVSPSNYGYCFARDSAGNTRSCYITVKYGTSLGVVGALNASSHLSVSYDTFGGTPYCTNIAVLNYSMGLP
jgi:hypothetical protein